MSSTKPTVLFLPKWYPYEADPFDGNFVENHAHAIKSQARICVLFVHSDKEAKQQYRIETKDNRGLYEMRVYFKKPQSGIAPLDQALTAIAYAKAQKVGYEQLKAEGWQFDLCHVHVLSRSAFLALELKKKEGIPYGITEHWSRYLPESNQFHGLLRKRFTAKAVKEASFVTTVSTYLKENMQRHGLKGNYSIIPNVVDEVIFQIGNRNPKQTEVIFVGNLLQKPKRILDILKVFAELSNEGHRFTLNIYGEGSDEDACKALIEKEGLEEVLKIKGTLNRDGIGKAMGSAAFLVLFSYFENQPCVISEAQAAGIPTVLPDLPGIKEFMRENLGLLIPTGDIAAFKAACGKMLETYPQYDREAIRQYALDTFSESAIGKQFGNLYQKALTAK